MPSRPVCGPADRAGSGVIFVLSASFRRALRSSRAVEERSSRWVCQRCRAGVRRACGRVRVEAAFSSESLGVLATTRLFHAGGRAGQHDVMVRVCAILVRVCATGPITDDTLRHP